jgi:hypothetical protein
MLGLRKKNNQKGSSHKTKNPLWFRGDFLL